MSVEFRSGAGSCQRICCFYAKFFSRSHDAVIRVYDEAGNVLETHEHIDDFKEPLVHFFSKLPRCFSALLSYSLPCSNG